MLVLCALVRTSSFGKLVTYFYTFFIALFIFLCLLGPLINKANLDKIKPNKCLSSDALDKLTPIKRDIYKLLTNRQNTVLIQDKNYNYTYIAKQQIMCAIPLTESFHKDSDYKKYICHKLAYKL